MYTIFLFENLRGRAHFENVVADGEKNNIRKDTVSNTKLLRLRSMKFKRMRRK
jgi:hypothetical protein